MIMTDKIQTLCKIRELNKAVTAFETRFEEAFHVGLNEGMLLCTLSNLGQLSSGEIADHLGLRTSNTSKVIRSVELKGLVKRVVGKEDKRQMYFSLTPEGAEALKRIKCDVVEVPDILQQMLVHVPDTAVPFLNAEGQP